MVPGTEHSPPRARPAAEPEPKRSRWLRGPRIYYLLAAFDVLTVSASLYLNHRIMRIYVGSVEANQDWAQRMADYSALGELAAAVNAPGNDVFHSRDVAAESARTQSALGLFQARVRALRGELQGITPREEVAPLLESVDEIERAMGEMVVESELLFAHFAGGKSGEAGERMASMDQKYARLLAALRKLSAEVAAVQRRRFDRQTAAAAALQRYEYLIAGLILVMVGAATVYGRKLTRQTARDARERSLHIAELHAAGESLRRAHDELENRVQERTRELRDSEAALRRAAAEWQLTFEAIDAPILIVDQAGRALRLNRAACERSGRSATEARTLALEALAPGEPWQAAAAVARRVREQASPATERVLDARTGKTWEIAGNLVREEDRRGEERAIVVAYDVTQLVELQESLRREERMAAIGALVAGVAHEVRNPLFGITSTLDAFESRHGGSEPIQRYMTVLRREADRLGSLMRDLLVYGKPAVLELSQVEFERAVEEAARLCEPLAQRSGVRIEKPRASGAGKVVMDLPRMLQVLQNLIQNAIQHSPAESAVVLSGGRSHEHGRDWVWCSILDFGPGFQVADLPHVFEPFFTRRGGGTGLGLSIAQRIVTQHGGNIVAANHPDGGALVTLKLPARGVGAPHGA